MPISPLNETVLRYFKQEERKKMPVCTVYISGHGSEIMNEHNSDICDSATVYSFAGVLGVPSFAFYDEDTESNISDTYLDMMKQHPPATTETIKEKTSMMASAMKDVINKKIIPLVPKHRKWVLKNKMHILRPIKQLTKKEFSFFLSDTEDPRMFHFGIYITDISYPPNVPPDKKLEQLRGVNIISPSFLSSNFLNAVEYLQELIHTEPNRTLLKEHHVHGTSLASITFEELIILLKKLGFEYSYIFDDSCRGHTSVYKRKQPSPETRKAIHDWTIREKNISLKHYKQKMKSADTQKNRIKSRSIKSLKSDKSFKRMEMFKKKEEFYNNILENISETLLILFDAVITMNDVIKEDNIIISIGYYEGGEETNWFDIHVKTKFLKIVSVNIIDKGYQEFIEPLRNTSKYKKLRKRYILLKKVLNLMIGKTFETLKILEEYLEELEETIEPIKVIEPKVIKVIEPQIEPKVIKVIEPQIEPKVIKVIEPQIEPEVIEVIENNEITPEKVKCVGTGCMSWWRKTKKHKKS